MEVSRPVNIFVVSLMVFNVITAWDKPPKLEPDSSSINIATGSTLQIMCSGEYDLEWSTPPTANTIGDRSRTNEEFDNNSGLYQTTLTVTNALYSDTGYFTCSYNGTSKDSLGNSSSIYVFVNDDDNLLAPMEHSLIVISPNKKTVIPCRPTNPDAIVRLKKHDELVSTNSNDIRFDNRVGFIILFANIFYSDGFTCIAELNNKTNTSEVVLLWNDISSDLPLPIIDLNGFTHVIVGNTVTFTCLINVQDNMSTFILSWKYPNKGNKRIIEGETLKTIRTSKNGGETVFYETVKNLTVENIDESDQGVYTCTVSNHANAELDTQTYVVVHSKEHTKLDVTADFSNYIQNVSKGTQFVRYVARITALPGPAQVYWLKDEKKFSCNDRSKCEIDINQKQTTLTLKNLNSSDTANYTVVAKMGNLEKRVRLTLWVTGPPTVNMRSKYGYYLKNTNKIIECNVNALPPAEIKWGWSPCAVDGCIRLRNRLSSHLFPNPNSENVTNVQRGFQRVVSNLNVTALKTGIYECEAKNKHGKQIAEHFFIVTDFSVNKTPKVFGISPVNESYFEKERVELECFANKFNFSANMVWKFEPSVNRSIELYNTTGLTITKVETEYSYKLVATFDSIKVENSGKYNCDAFGVLNSKTTRASHMIKVSAVKAPFVLETNMDGSIYSKKDVFRFICNVSGSPEPTVTWKKNNETLDKQQDVQFNFIGDAILEVRRAVVEDSGVYICEVSNREGSITLNATLLVEGTSGSSEMASHVKGIIAAVVVIVVLAVIILSAILARKCYLDRKERQEIYELEKELFERGAIERYNPDIPLDEQIDILPYDSRWEFPKEKLKLGKTLGQGAFGRVVKAEAYGILADEKCTIVAVKMLKERASIEQRKAIMQELKIMIHLGHHINILNLLGACVQNPRKGELLIIMEHCHYGCLRNYLLRNRSSFVNQINPETGEIDVNLVNAATNFFEPHSPTSPTYNSLGQDGYLVPLSPTTSYPTSGAYGSDTAENSGDDSSGFGRQYTSPAAKKPLTSCDLVAYAFQIARGMEYLAFRKLVHRDLALRNILLAKNNIIKISDFGLTKDCYKKAYYRKKGDAPLPVKWMAIESIRDRIFSTESDVWSFGVVLWELFSLGGNPYPGLEVDENFYRKLLCGYRMDKPEFGTDEFNRIMNECWNGDPQQRPTFYDLSEWIGDQLQSGLREHYVQLNDEYIKLHELTTPNPDYVNMKADGAPNYANVPQPLLHQQISETSTSDDDMLSPHPNYLDMRGSNTPSMKSYESVRAAKNELKPMLPSSKDDLFRVNEQKTKSENSPLSVKYAANPADIDQLRPGSQHTKPPTYSTVMNGDFSV